jgi:hypothetical protein
MKTRRADQRKSAAVCSAASLLLIGVSACESGSAPSSTDASGPERPGWQVMGHIKLAAFSATDLGEYDLMIFCEDDHHVRLYHLVAPNEPSDRLLLRSGAARLDLQGERQEERVSPPPVTAGDGPVVGVRIMARLDQDAPVWRSFLRTGGLEVTSGARLTRADADASERAELSALFAACAT